MFPHLYFRNKSTKTQKQWLNQEISEISHQKVSPKLGNDGVDASGSRAQLLALEPSVSKNRLDFHFHFS